jgi:hypothetical protein
MKRLLTVLLSFGLLAAPAMAASQPLDEGQGAREARLAAEAVDVEGRGLSEEAALQDAFRNAIEAVVGVMINAETEVSNFQTVRDRIFSHAEGYVASHKVLDRFQHPDGSVGLRVRVAVTERSIHDDLVALKVLQQQLGNPKLVVSYDPHGPQHAMTGLAVDRMNAYLAAKGIAYVQAPEGEAAATAIAEQADAAVVLSADLRETRRSGEWRFVKARVQIRIHEAATLRGLGTETGYSRELAMRSGVVSGYEAATEEAVKDAADRTLKLLLTHWKSDAYQGRPYRVVLRGIDGYEQQRRFTELLKEVGRQVKLESSGKGEATFTVWSREPVDGLLDRVMTRSRQTPLKLELSRQEAGRLELRLKSR